MVLWTKRPSVIVVSSCIDEANSIPPPDELCPATEIRGEKFRRLRDSRAVSFSYSGNEYPEKQRLKSHSVIAVTFEI